ncbi:MAG: TolC family protein [Bacteroidetes bacterium]|nr:TolC family protein [Bacteroidota bacterium]MBS1758099.1 TolC family protein [Bacteroidota bacterium]
MTDTIKFSIDSLDHVFLQNNLQLLAQKYNIDAQRALEAQAKLYPNPNVQFSSILYNSQSKQLLPVGTNGEVTAQLSQMIILAGKRNKQIKMAQANTQLTQLQFIDLLQTLKFTLHTDFYSLYYLHKSASAYTDEISSLQTLNSGFETQLTQGNVSKKEALRIKAQLYSLQSEYNDLINKINDIQSEVRTILHLQKVFIMPTVDEQWVNNLSATQFPLQTIIDSAMQNHSDLKIAKLNTEINQMNYGYQKAMAVPDLTVIAGYDQQGSFTKNYNSIGIAMDLPFFNRNQGNIRSAKIQTQIAQVNEQNTEATIQENIYNVLTKAATYDNLLHSRDTQFDQSFKALQQSTLENYRQRNINLLDFLDFYDAYKNNVLQINSIQINRLTAFEAINYYSGSIFYK